MFALFDESVCVLFQSRNIALFLLYCLNENEKFNNSSSTVNLICLKENHIVFSIG